MKILVCGDRNWTNCEVIHTTLKQFQPYASLIVHGAARGADTLAGGVAESLNIPVQSFPANWDKHGSAAGPIRNIDMFVKTQPDVVIAFHDDLYSSKGTKHMVDYARSKGVKVFLVNTKCEVTEFIILG